MAEPKNEQKKERQKSEKDKYEQKLKAKYTRNNEAFEANIQFFSDSPFCHRDRT